MFKAIQAAGVALTMAAAAVVSSVPAGAQDLELRIGPEGVRPVIRDNDRRGPPPPRRGCDERQARAAAREAGLRDPEVVRVTPGRVIVEGYTRRGLERITFANERGCPEI